MIADRDFNVEHVESMHHVAGMANIGNRVNRNRQRKPHGDNDKRRQKRQKTDKDLERQLAEQKPGFETDNNDDHIDFRA